MRKKPRKPSVPGVLWRLFRNRARTLSNTIISLLPSPPTSSELCHCNGHLCLGCTTDPNSFLLRPDDPSDYRKLLSNCYVVVSEKAPPIPFFIPHSHCTQNQIVTSIIELMLELASSNVLCSGYDRSKCSSPNVDLLSCASWCLLLSRVGDDFMVYLLKNASIFLPTPNGKHYQVGGPPISRLCFDKFKGSSKFDYQHPSLNKCGAGTLKRKRTYVDDTTVQKQKIHLSCNTSGPVGFASNIGLAGKSSMQLISHHGNKSYGVSTSETPTSASDATFTRKSESEEKPDFNCITPKPQKRSRPFSWQRLRCKKKQTTFEENNQNMHCSLLPSNTECLDPNLQNDKPSLSFHEKVQMLCQCSCCLILQSPPTVPRWTDIKRKSIFHNLESSLSVLPEKRIPS